MRSKLHLHFQHDIYFFTVSSLISSSLGVIGSVLFTVAVLPRATRLAVNVRPNDDGATLRWCSHEYTRRKKAII